MSLQVCIRERSPDLWHVCRGDGDSCFQPIACHDREGINLPGNRVVREPTCPDCFALTNPRHPVNDESPPS